MPKGAKKIFKPTPIAKLKRNAAMMGVISEDNLSNSTFDPCAFRQTIATEIRVQLYPWTLGYPSNIRDDGYGKWNREKEENEDEWIDIWEDELQELNDLFVDAHSAKIRDITADGDVLQKEKEKEKVEEKEKEKEKEEEEEEEEEEKENWWDEEDEKEWAKQSQEMKEKCQQFREAIEISNSVESSIFNATIEKEMARTRNTTKLHWNNVEIVSKYNVIMKSVLFNIMDSNCLLRDRIVSGEVLAHTVGSLTYYEMNPELWAEKIAAKLEVDKNKFQKKEVGSTKMFTCISPTCLSTNCTTYSLQTRSADEPATIFITCVVCGTEFSEG